MNNWERMARKLAGTRRSIARHRKTVTVLAALVVFVTTYALVLPAITLDSNKAEATPGIETGTTAEEPNEKASAPSQEGEDPVEPKAKADQGESKQSKASESDEASNKSDSAVKSEKSDTKINDAKDSDSEDNNADKDGTEKDDIELIKEKTELKFDGDGYKVVAECGTDTELPSDVKLKVTEVRKNTKDENGDKYEFEEYRDKALEAVRDKDGKDGDKRSRRVRLFDISFVSESTGETVEPDADVKVTIKYDNAFKINDENKVRAVHFDETKPEIKAEVIKTKTDINSENKMKETSFEADKFSVYGVVYTVDFAYGLDGEQSEFSIQGGGAILLTDILSNLDVKPSKGDKNDTGTGDDVDVEKEGNEALVGEIENVEFTDPNLVWVGKAEEDTTVGALREANGLESEYSALLSDEEINEINEKAVTAGDWVLISLKPFDTEETLTVTMKNGEQFEIKVTDVSYQGTKVTDPDGKTVALLNLENNNALQSSAHSTAGRLRATGIQVNGTRITSEDPLTAWTFTKVPNTTDQYYIQASNGYLNISTDNPTGENNCGSIYVSSQPQALTVQQKSNGTIRIKRPDNNYAVNNHGNRTSDGYGAYNSGWDSNPGEWFTMYEIGEPIVPHVTVHYVDREGNPISGVAYGGNNPLVVQNTDGTFTIPYDWGNGQTTDTSIDLRKDFSKKGYTYANTHLAGKTASGTALTHEGYLIDSVLSRSGSDLQFKSDSGETNNPYPFTTIMGNLAYGELTSFSLSGNVSARPTDNGDRIPYATSGNKDIYVILDPLPSVYPDGTLPDTGIGEPDVPKLTKEMEENGDGTYNLSLTVDAHANSASDTNRANILFVVDTSSSMRNTTSSNSRNRIMDTHDAVKELGQKFLKYNDSKPGAVQVSMITFDGGVDERLPWTDDMETFEQSVDEYLRYYYLHKGTDWEDAMKEALDRVQHPVDDDPTFVIFFTDGEPSQYTNFHGKGYNNNPDPTGSGSSMEPVPGGDYPNFYSYFLSREGSKDEMRAIVDAGAKLYGIYAYNSTNESYNGYNGPEDGANMLHNAIKYGYNTSNNLENRLFFEAHNTNDLQRAFDSIFNQITESVGFSNVTVTDGISTDVTSTTVVNGDVSGFTYEIRNSAGALDYKVTVAPNGVPDGQSVADETPIFTIGSGPPVVGEKKNITIKKVKTGSDGKPILDGNNKIQTEDVQVEVYYYKDSENDKEYIMPIATPARTVKWDLAPLGMLKDGYSYEVNFVVWPNQDSYDLVADLNNGIKPEGVTENWNGLDWHTDSKNRRYKIGGISGHDYIALYEDGTYAALSNTDQKVKYYKVDNAIVNGQEVTIYEGPTETTVDPPDPMRLTASESQIEKIWNVERDPKILAQLLYNPDGTSKKYKIGFDVMQGSQTTPYVTVDLGWDETKGAYQWDSDSVQTVDHNGHDVQVGTRWSNDFAIATGLMLSEAKMKERGLNPGLYPHVTYGDKTYYILETGHDYTIKEPSLGYAFDFDAPVYHPMLVDGVLRSVEFEGEGNARTIKSMTPQGQTLSSLKIENTLRGYIHVKKKVVGPDGETPVTDDETKFTFNVSLENTADPGPFTGDHIPWYGINSLFYHTVKEVNGENEYDYYQADMTSGHLRLTDEDGNTYNAEVVGGGSFDPDSVGPTKITFTDNEGDEKIIDLYGNQMDCTDANHASAEFQITQAETLNIANVPVGTKFTVIESAESGYEYAGITTNVQDAVITNSGMKVEGDIVPDSDNNITYTNKALVGALKLKKKVTVNGRPTDTTLADGTYVFNVEGKEGTDTADKSYTVKITIENGTAVSAAIKDNKAALPVFKDAELNNGSVILKDLTPGEYKVTEEEDSDTTCTSVTSSKASDGQGSTDTRSITVNIAPGSGNITLVTFVNDCLGVGLDIVKVDKTNRNKKLSGAVFTITRLDPATTKTGHISYKMKADNPEQYEFTAQSDPTGDDGKTSFSGLNYGYYEVKETVFPAGYVSTGYEVFYIKADNGVVSYLAVDPAENTPITDWSPITQTSTDDTVQLLTVGVADDPQTDENEAVNTSVSVGNTPGAALPSSGGPGTTWMYIIGMLLTIGAGITLVSRRRIRSV